MAGELREDYEERDEQLLREALSAPDGDLRAFEQLVLQYQNRIVADCRYMTRDESSAEDLAQEIFVKAFFGLRRFEGRSSFRHWLQRIKVHHCLNHIKRQEGKKRMPIETAAPKSSSLFKFPLLRITMLRPPTTATGSPVFWNPCRQHFASPW